MLTSDRMDTGKTLSLEALHVIVVAVSSPDNAPFLLRLAAGLIDPKDGRILALFVRLENDEEQNDLSDEIEQVIKAFSEEQHEVELLVRHSSVVARAILDFTREVQADLIIMGTSNADERHPIARNVIPAAPCAVMIAHQPAEFERIVVPVDDSDHARVACAIGLRLARYCGVGMAVVGTQRRGHTPGEIKAQLRRALRNLPGEDEVRRIVVPTDDPVEGLLSETTAQDLILLGFARQTLLEKWLFSDFSRPLLERAGGPVLLTTSAENGQDTFIMQLRQRLRWLLPTLTDDEQETLVWTAHEQAAPTLDYWVLLTIAALIATAGLLLDSATLIIGAMLVAPLRSPIMAFATGLTTGRLDLMRRGVPTLLLGVALVVVVAFLLGNAVVIRTPTGEMRAWSQPTLLDAAVALAAGVAGAYAAARKNVSDALAGVAIAAALTPAVCTVGIGIGTGNLDMALGAALLFVTNFVCISLAGWATFFWMGMRPRVVEQSRQRQYLSIALLMVLALPFVAALISLSNQQTVAEIVEERLQEAFLPAELVEVDVTDGDVVDVLATVRSTEPITTETVAIIEDTLASELQKAVELGVVALPIITDSDEGVTPEETPQMSP